ncbi:ABC transporter substrate-binding protein [Actinoplanes subtropicus]|uniref:ABC transporter substrate-binding protein n=1 Tax=Actinoplanes subtropicus TaxID=543632 RepID=UPI000A448A42|nr:ABC transporter substrate-binding protein [Actinoplanes subtropicus]
MSIHGVASGKRASAALVALVGAIALTACSSSSSGGGSSPSGGGSSPASAADTSACGTKPGVKAIGTPIKLGAIATQQPGIDFTDAPNMIKAYFACVNDNGGIKGHPIEYVIKTEQTQPAQIAAAASQLIQSGVLGVVGNMSVLECTVNHATWEKLGYYTIGAGVAAECYSTPNSAAVNMGPRFSTVGAVQFALTKGVDKVVLQNPQLPNVDHIAEGAKAVADAAKVPFILQTAPLPIRDPNSIALRAVQAAGANGAVVLDYTPSQALQILQAAQKLGLTDRVKVWACSTPCNTDFLAEALGSKWNNKLFVNAELAPPSDTNNPSMNLYRAVIKQYGQSVTGGIGHGRFEIVDHVS